MALQTKLSEMETIGDGKQMIRYFGRRRFARFLPLVFCAVVLFISGCVVGPNYKRPIVNSPNAYRGLTDAEAANPAPASLGDQKWWEVFQDQQLQQLIRTALQQNYDVRIAATPVLEAQAQLRITTP